MRVVGLRRFLPSRGAFFYGRYLHTPIPRIYPPIRKNDSLHLRHPTLIQRRLISVSAFIPKPTFIRLFLTLLTGSVGVVSYKISSMGYNFSNW